MTYAPYHDLVVTESVDGIRYTSTKLPTMAGLNLMGRTGIALGEHGLRTLVLAKVSTLDAIMAEVIAGTAVSRVVAAGLVQLARGLVDDPELARELCQGLKTETGAVADRFESHFSGEYPHLFKVLAFVLRHNFMGFTRGSLSTGGSHTSDATPTDAPSGSETPSKG